MGPLQQTSNIYFLSGLYFGDSGDIYNPPPPPKNHPNLLLQSGYKIKLQNGDYLALQGYE